ncbi:hypothetical protein [Herpetosiphon geysericola]|uniref:Uncharacterized protein n=1 Tax=Herpetosiphon geysericola TaxID=70996 RepID=A0A0P6XUJ7_9CHLR|nr:hypothetical protein [Herpetosiphon geysericola]KPL80235.1 hypothetical protein SE18_24585 [Herpetosiphon geysericola]
MTKILFPDIDPNARGSYTKDAERQAIRAAYQEAVTEFNEAVDSFNAAREAASISAVQDAQALLERAIAANDEEVIASAKQSLIDLNEAITAEAVTALQEATNALGFARKDLNAKRAAWEAYVHAHLVTDDGSDLSAALNEITINEMNDLIYGAAKEVTIPNLNGGN